MDQSQTGLEQTSTNLTQKELNILKKTTKLSEKEIKLWHKQFYTSYPTGKAVKEEFLQLLKEMFPTIEQDDLTTAFDAVDQNRDGVMDFSEYLFALAFGSTVSSLEERLDDAFNLWDVSNDGYLNQNELAHLISAMYDRAGVKDRQGEKNPMSRAKAIITKLDTNGDKKLSKEEFISRM